jgi:hypothetical protein
LRRELIAAQLNRLELGLRSGPDEVADSKGKHQAGREHQASGRWPESLKEIALPIRRPHGLA